MIRHLTVALAYLLVCSPASAVTGSVNFTGTVASVCTLVVTDPGVMKPSADLKGMSSKNGGGSPGKVTLTTTGGVNLSVDTSVTENRPVGDLSPTIWVPSYSMAGMLAISDTSITTPIASNGTGTIDVHLSGTKIGSNSFIGGSYSATVVVRCE